MGELGRLDDDGGTCVLAPKNARTDYCVGYRNLFENNSIDNYFLRSIQSPTIQGVLSAATPETAAPIES